MKRIILLLLLFYSGLLLADIRDIAIDGGNYTVNQDDTLRVYINAYDIDLDMRVIAFQFDLYYPEDAFKFIDHNPGDLFENAMLMANGDNPGLVKTACSHWQPQQGSGTLIEFVFLATEAGEFSFQLDKFKMNSTQMIEVFDPTIKVLPTKVSKDKN